ncbi:tRNA pseudouridine(55) synthase TruB [Sporosarcina sp. ACRSL]|uniref:tRNA pseudouridine(55) synthase TruB n=1 Tax=Sporosarcina sp. ACRSL TaxID=2918215 RepID=UPI001EF6F793|nr:tRNA pseudouridine(55) synthase TruB [Sporosarcina sp. ACRSL]MCG7342913.1 tRNA pseudouridine(55) synthase TruB [Sporosarcina sp. ACRSL]
MDGILPLWKQKGMTSHDCVFKLRKIFGMKKVGHTGTLDPNVEGVLPICLGQATKVAEYITDAGKEYIATVSIGTSTETEDGEGAIVLSDNSYKKITRKEILQALEQLTGKIVQIPPMYSAVKVKGKRLYEYARKGIEVERPKRLVHIYEIELLDDQELFEGEQVNFKIRIACGKGTYIRTLSVQIGEQLGFPAHMASLVRTVSGNFRQQDCLTLEEVEKQKKEGTLEQYIRPLEEALAEFEFVETDDELYGKIMNGQVLQQHPSLMERDEIVFTKSEKVIAIYRNHPTKKGLMKPEKMFPFNR